MWQTIGVCTIVAVWGGIFSYLFLRKFARSAAQTIEPLLSSPFRMAAVSAVLFSLVAYAGTKPSPIPAPETTPAVDPEPDSGSTDDSEPDTGTDTEQPASEPDPASDSDPDPAPETDPESNPGSSGDPAPDTGTDTEQPQETDSKPVEEDGFPQLYGSPASTPFKGNETYIGWLRDENGELAGTLTVKAAKPDKNGRSKISATHIPLGGKKRTVKLSVDEMPFAGEIDAALIPGVGTVKFGGESLAGVDCNLQAGVDFVKSKDKAAKVRAASRLEKFAGGWTFALDGDDGAAAFQVAIDRKGKGKLSGTLPDGTTVSVSVQGVLGDDALAVPFAYSKKGAFAFVFWARENGTAEISDLTGTVSGKAIQTDVVAPSRNHALADGSGHVFDCELFDGGQSFTVKNDKWDFGKHVRKPKDGQADPNPHEIKLSFAAKTGAVKGSFSVLDENGKKQKYTMNGVVVDGSLYGSAVNRKTGFVRVFAK